jgi:hypothetical protein
VQHDLVIVGNGQRLLEQDLGSWIDAHRLVLRMNWGFPSRHPEKLGTRTDILAVSCDITAAEIFREYSPKLVVVASPRHERFPNVFDAAAPDGQRLADVRTIYPKQWWNELYERFGEVRPSTGAMILYACAKLGISADVVGFDFLKTKSWYNDIRPDVPHSGPVEERFAMELVGEGRIVVH